MQTQTQPKYGSAEWFRQLNAECERQDAAKREREYWERMDNMTDREWKRMERAE